MEELRTGSTDLELLGGVLRLDQDALLRFGLRMRCIPRILAGLNARRGRPLRDEDIEDLAQDAFVVVWRKLPEFDGRAPLEAWVFRTCLFEFSNRVRKERRRGHLFADVAAQAADRSPGAAPVPDEPPEDEVHRGMETLDADEQEIVRLRHFLDLSFDQAAERTGVPSSTLKTRYYRALQKLESFFSNRDENLRKR